MHSLRVLLDRIASGVGFISAPFIAWVDGLRRSLAHQNLSPASAFEFDSVRRPNIFLRSKVTLTLSLGVPLRIQVQRVPNTLVGV